MALQTNILVVGAGAAGLAAAIKAHDLGVDVLVVDREDFPGGILRQCIHTGFGVDYYREELTGPEYLHRLWDAARERGITIELETTVLDVSDGTIATLVSPSRGVFNVEAGATILATGSYERTRENLGIAGDRPAGVFTAGQAQQLINLHGLRIGSRVVVQGTGDIGLIITRRLMLEGYDVVAVFERLPIVAGLRRNRAQCLDDFDIDPEFSRQIVNIHGRSRVEGVTAVARDSAHPEWDIPGTEKFIECDTVVLSAGLIPNRELANDVVVEQISKSLQVRGTRIFLAGNAVEIHDLADGASKQGERAATSAVSAIGGNLDPQLDMLFVPGEMVSRWSVRDETLDRSEGAICLVCPRGCILTDEDYGCRRGKLFMEQERKRKLRTLTTTTWTLDQDRRYFRIAIKTTRPVALDQQRNVAVAVKNRDEKTESFEMSHIGPEMRILGV